MAAKGVEEKPSQTALFGAMRRYIAHREYPNSRFGSDDLAARFLPPSFQFLLRFEKVRLNVKERLNGAFPGMHEYIIARTAYFDRLFTAALNEQTPQIVLLGAGYDSRAYRFASLNQGTRIFELDATPTQARKKKCLKRAKPEDPLHLGGRHLLPRPAIGRLDPGFRQPLGAPAEHHRL
jgi:methyltransferase (TIGR00027 family)